MKILISQIGSDTKLFDLKSKRTEFDIPELSRDVQLHAEIDGFNVSGLLKSTIKLQCDRCLDTFTMPLEEKFRVLLSYDSEDNKDIDVILLDPDAEELDMQPYVRDTLLLSIPFKKLCSEDCRGLCVSCGVNLNRETCSCEQSRIDPRWDALKEIKKTLDNAEE